MERLEFRLDSDVLAALDRIATARDLTRSATIRALIMATNAPAVVAEPAIPSHPLTEMERQRGGAQPKGTHPIPRVRP